MISCLSNTGPSALRLLPLVKLRSYRVDELDAATAAAAALLPPPSDIVFSGRAVAACELNRLFLFWLVDQH